MPEVAPLLTEGAPAIAGLVVSGGGIGGAAAPPGCSSIEEAEAAPATGGGDEERLGLEALGLPDFPEEMGYMEIPVSTWKVLGSAFRLYWVIIRLIPSLFFQ